MTSNCRQSNKKKIRMTSISERGRLSVRGLRAETLAEFKDFVRTKHGKLHTAMGKEVERALLLYLNTHTQIYKHSIIEASRSEKTMYTIIMKLKENEGLCENLDKNLPALRRIIRLIAGLDPRTIKKYEQEIMRRWQSGEFYDE